MPTNDTIVSIPLVGGLNQQLDPDQLQPPELMVAENVVARRGGRLEKRPGYQLVETESQAGVPAVAFGGSSSAVSADVEAIGAYHGKDGARAVLAAGNRLYEYVGSDATHGWRDVNRLPSCIGTLHPVTATGGEIIEAESMLNDDGTLRCTAWVAGYRTGQEMTDDGVVSSQPSDTRGLYVAVQRVSDGSYITAPVRIKSAALANAAQVNDLRMTRCVPTSGITSNWVIAFRMQYTDAEAFVVDATNGYVFPSQQLVAPAGWVTGAPYHRSYDITGVSSASRIVLAWCQPSTTATSTDVTLQLFSIDVFGTFTLVATTANYIASVGATGTAGGFAWSNYAARGVVLETDAVTSDVGIAIRAMYWTTGGSPVLDGKMVVSKFSVTPSTITVTSGSWSWLHRIGFQSREDFISSVAAIGTQRMCISAGASITGKQNVAPQESGIISGVHGDGTVQAYRSVCSSNGLTWAITGPYVPYELTNITASGLYPAVSHKYLNNQTSTIMSPGFAPAATLGLVQIYQTSITQASVAGAPSSFLAYANTVQYVRMNIAGTPVAYAMIAFGATGTPVEVALYNGINGYIVTGVPAVYHPDSFNVGSSYVGPWGAPVVIAAPLTTFSLRDDLNTTGGSPYPVSVSAGLDYPTELAQVSQVNFDSLTSPDMCVHRWDVKRTSFGMVLAISSTAAGLFASPNGDVAYGYVSPFAENNFFEVYEWGGASGASLNSYTGGSVASLWTAIGGPWRLISSLFRDADERLYCVVTPSGDSAQRTMLLLSFSRPSSLVSVSRTGKLPSQGGATMLGGENYVYSESPGVFVESLNMARVAAIPLNCPRLTMQGSAVSNTENLTVGAIRQGQSVGGGEVFSVEYDRTPAAWRRMVAWGDYTAISGGLVSSFDGSSCKEVTPLIWPQRDLTSIAYDRQATKIFIKNSLTRRDDTYSNYSRPLTGVYPSFLSTITRPWLAYEAGFVNLNGDGWSDYITSWGGDPTKDWQTVYSDPRQQQVFARGGPSTASAAQAITPSHYYGRYQSGSQATWIRQPLKAYVTILWAPRATQTEVELVPYTPVPDADIKSASIYTPAVANGDFLVRWCYESVDGTGRVVRSAPSGASGFSIFAKIVATVIGAPALPLNELEQGGSIAEYQYGFFVPRLELTNRLNTAQSDPTRVVLQPYFTAEPFAAVSYRVPFSAMAVGARGAGVEYGNDLTVPRNATRGVVPYSVAAKGGGQLGLCTSNRRCFDGPQGDYNGLLAQPYLYTTGGVLDNVSPPSAKVMCIHQNRLILGGADDTSVIWMSKELTPTEAPGFNEALTLTISDAGAVTGLASLNGNLIIFKRNAIFVVPGVLPDATGAAPSMGEPIKLPAGVGCIEHRSVLETPVGVFFLSERGLEILYPTLQVAQIGQKVRETLAAYPRIVSAIHHPNDQEARFLLESDSGTNHILVDYSYQFNIWSTHQIDYLGGAQKMGEVDGIPWLAASAPATWSGMPQAAIYRQSEVSALDILPSVAGPNINYVKMTVVTAPIDVHQVQGFQRVKRARLLMTNNVHPEIAPDLLPGVGMAALTDYNASLTGGQQQVAWTAAQVRSILATQGRVQVEVHLREQKGQAVQIAYIEGSPASSPLYTDKGWGLAISNVALVVGLKKGLDKRILPDAKR